MALSRESLMTALLAKLTAAYAWATPPSRRLVEPTQLGNDAQPTAFLLEPLNEQATHVKGLPMKWTLHPSIIVYARADDMTTAPGPVINPIKDAIEKSLEDNTTQGLQTPTTLGSLCLHCRILGVHLAPGYVDGQIVALIDLEILVTAGGPP